MEELAESNAKRVRLSGRFDPSGLSGIRDFKEDSGSASFLYSGDMNILLNRLSGGDIRDLNISEPDLEEVFLHYYEKEEGRQ